MHLSGTALSCPTYRLPEALAFTRQAGLGAIELFRDRTESSPVHPDFSVRTVREALASAGVRLSAFSVRNLTGMKADTSERNLDYNLRQLTWDIHLARALGLKHASLSGGSRSEENLEDVVAGVNRLLEALPPDFELNLANAPDNRLQGMADFRAVMPRVGPRAKILLDTGALLAAGEEVLPFAQAFADRIGRVRLGDRRGDAQASLGGGDLPLEDLLKILQKAGFGGDLILSVEPLDGADALPAVRAAREYVEKALAGL